MFLFGFYYLSLCGDCIHKLICLTTRAKNDKVDKDFHITLCSHEVELLDKCQISSIINLWELTILSVCQILYLIS